MCVIGAIHIRTRNPALVVHAEGKACQRRRWLRSCLSREVHFDELGCDFSRGFHFILFDVLCEPALRASEADHVNVVVNTGTAGIAALGFCACWVGEEILIRRAFHPGHEAVGLKERSAEDAVIRDTRHRLATWSCTIIWIHVAEFSIDPYPAAVRESPIGPCSPDPSDDDSSFVDPPRHGDVGLEVYSAHHIGVIPDESVFRPVGFLVKACKVAIVIDPHDRCADGIRHHEFYIAAVHQFESFGGASWHTDVCVSASSVGLVKSNDLAAAVDSPSLG